MDTCLSICYLSSKLIFKVLPRMVEILEVKERAGRVRCVRCNDFKRSENACCVIVIFSDSHVFTPCAVLPVCDSPVRRTASFFVIGTLRLQSLVFRDLDLLSSAAAG